MPPPVVTLSSSLSVPLRVVYGAIGLGAAALGVVDLLRHWPPTLFPLTFSHGLVAAAVIGIPVLLRMTAFRTTLLEGNHIVVHGLVRRWRIPVDQIASIHTSSPEGWTMVRVTLRGPVRGMGRHLRILSPFGQATTFVAELLEVTRTFPQAGASRRSVPTAEPR